MKPGKRRWKPWLSPAPVSIRLVWPWTLWERRPAWLAEHCWEYGFILRYTEEKAEITGITNEPWHFRYVGREISMDMKDSGLCLEEYLGAV